MYTPKPYDQNCGFSEKTHNLIEEMCRLVEREDYELDKINGQERVLQTYDLFNIPRPKIVVWCKDIFDENFVKTIRSARSAWSARSARSAGSARSAWSARSARSAWSALDYDFNWFVVEHEYTINQDGGAKPNKSDKMYLDYSELLLRAVECGVGYRVQFEDTLYLVPAPLVKIDNQNRFHSLDPLGNIAPAIRWKDGRELYRLHGVAFEDKDDLANHLALSVKKTLRLQNVDKRTVLMMNKSPDAVFDEMDCKLIDTAKVPRKYGELEYELYEVNGLTDQTEKMLRYKCASFERTGKTYTKFVEPHYTSALEAIANSQNLTPELYRLVTKQG